MARSTGGNDQPLAIELLSADHRKVEMLFEQFEEEKEGDEDTKRGLAERICAELTIHAQVEEELFYPWVREQLDDDDMEMLEEAYVEHASAKNLIAQIQGAGDMGPEFDARMKVLSEYIKHHVKEEEEEVFAEVRGEKEALDELGQEMAARKAELMEEMGLSEDEGDMAKLASRGKSGRSQSEQRRTR